MKNKDILIAALRGELDNNDATLNTALDYLFWCAADGEKELEKSFSHVLRKHCELRKQDENREQHRCRNCLKEWLETENEL